MQTNRAILSVAPLQTVNSYLYSKPMLNTDRQMDRLTDRRRDRQTERQTDGETDRQRDRQMERQTDNSSHMHAHAPGPPGPLYLMRMASRPAHSRLKDHTTV